MYVPHQFQNNNITEVRDFIRQNSFGILVNHSDGRPFATHIPLELETNIAGNEVLFGHISKANPQGKYFENQSKVLAIFSGANSYISSSWYDHENVPTWNYVAVHVYGSVKIIQGEELLYSLKKLVDKYEAQSLNPVKVESMSEKFLSDHINGIIGFEISVDEVQSAFKLSQNRDDKNHKSIVQSLKEKGDVNSLAVAAAMEKQRGRENKY